MAGSIWRRSGAEDFPRCCGEEGGFGVGEVEETKEVIDTGHQQCAAHETTEAEC